MSKDKQTGFTLLELSIVLVIIGLLVGAIFVGRDLIQSAEIRQQITNLQKYTSAMNTFKLKFGSMPGDASEANRTNYAMPTNAQIITSTLLGNDTVDTEGNCDLGPPWYHDACNSPEPEQFFVDLSWANLIPGNYQFVWGTGIQWVGVVWPRLTFNQNAGIMAFSRNGSVQYFLGMTSPVGAVWYHTDNQSGPVMTPFQAYSIDAKIDDAVPSTGTVLAVTVPQDLPTTDVTAGQCVVDATAKAYNVTNNTIWCRLLIKSQ